MPEISIKIKRDLDNLKNPAKAEILQRFFKTSKGQYGEGDKFLGIVVPLQRDIAKKYYKEVRDIKCLQKLLESKIHEYRQVALFILVYKFQCSNQDEQKKIFQYYIKNRKSINNWDLVDLTAPNIIGQYLLEKDKSILYKFAKSNDLWERRIAILSCFTFIKQNLFDEALKISEILLNDKHDLIHKAVGWMLREIGKRDKKTAKFFLQKYYKKMPRTMLRYAIEKFPEQERQFYLRS